jgi:hypothetical protein
MEMAKWNTPPTPTLKKPLARPPGLTRNIYKFHQGHTFRISNASSPSFKKSNTRKNNVSYSFVEMIYVQDKKEIMFRCDI